MMRYEGLRAWHAAHELALRIYQVIDRWPREDRFGLTAQLRRAALSPTPNIAEGAAKRGPKKFRCYLDIAIGSLSEVSSLLRFSRDYGLLSSEAWVPAEELRGHTSRLTWRLYLSVAKRASQQTKS
jgi:four helix bundle protein